MNQSVPTSRLRQWSRSRYPPLRLIEAELAGMGRTKLRGRAKVDWAFTFAAAAYNPVRLPKLQKTGP